MARAQERRVERLARRAASWSARCEGEIILYGVWLLPLLRGALALGPGRDVVLEAKEGRRWVCGGK